MRGKRGLKFVSRYQSIDLQNRFTWPKIDLFFKVVLTFLISKYIKISKRARSSLARIFNITWRKFSTTNILSYIIILNRKYHFAMPLMISKKKKNFSLDKETYIKAGVKSSLCNFMLKFMLIILCLFLCLF